MSDQGRGSAKGKLILLGEHAVVYGVPALVGGVGVELHAEARRTEGGEQRLRLLGTETVARREGDDELARAFAALLDEGGAPSGLEVVVAGELPAGVGLGFSAAAAVAIARAVEDLLDRGAPEAVRERAMSWERVYHGNPSGVDVAAAMHGGCLRFVRGEGVQRLALQRPLCLAVGLTGTRSSTREMVAGVARLKERNPEQMDKSLEAIRALVERAITAVADGDVQALGELMDLNQMVLSGMMLSTDTIEALCATAREAGALGAKLTGAGGGGAVVALAGLADDAGRRVAESVVGRWGALGYHGFVAELASKQETQT